MTIPKEMIEVFKDPSIEKIKFLVKWLWPDVKCCQNLTNTQAYIIKRILFKESKRISISAYTRYGKTQTVAIAMCIVILVGSLEKIKFIGPTDDQAGLIKDYMSELIIKCRDNILIDLSEIKATGSDRIKAEASQRRMTFKNGCEYRVVTAHGKGFSAMGHGGTIIVMDEAALISRSSYSKIVRMLGDDPEESMLIELFNPWDRDTKAFDHSISPRFERIRVSYEVGLSEGRITEKFLQEMREDMSSLEFTVLYESKFPNESEDSLHTLSSIEIAENKIFGFQDEINKLINDIKNPELSNEEREHRKDELKRYKKIISCDPADKGLDLTVIFWGICKDNKYYEPVGVFSEHKSESMGIVGKIIRKAIDYTEPEVAGVIQPDEIGLGVGILSRLRELKEERGLSNISVRGCHYGKEAMNKTEFINKKAENNFRLRQIFMDGFIALGFIRKNPEYHKIKTEILSMKWEVTSSEKKKIIDPEEKSPDYNDSLVYFVWKDNKELHYEFL